MGVRYSHWNLINADSRQIGLISLPNRIFSVLKSNPQLLIKSEAVPSTAPQPSK
ncbi:hypothetical protein P3L10_022311 [Capsicum annuum]